MGRAYLVPFLLCALLPLQVHAQAPSPLGEEPQGEIIPRDWETSASVGRGGRIALGSLAGLLLGIAGGVPGAFLMIAENIDCDGCASDSTVILGGLVGIAGVSAGAALGVTLAGLLFDGEGRYLHTLLYAVVGAGAGGLAALMMSQTEGLWAIPLITFPVVGAVIGYEVSHSSEHERMAAEATGVTVLPSVGVHPSGGVVAGLVGRF